MPRARRPDVSAGDGGRAPRGRSTSTPVTSARRAGCRRRGSGPASPTPARRPRPAACRARAAPGDVGGDRRADGLLPAAEHATDLGPAGAAAQRPQQPVERLGDRHRVVVVTVATAASTDRRRPAASSADDACRRRRAARARARAAAGTAAAVVITTCPAGRCCEQRRRPAGVELGQHVVEHEHRRRPGALGDQPVGGEPQRQRQRALLALRGVGARRQPVDRQRQLVAVRPDRRHAAPDVGVARLGERGGQPGCAATAGRRSAATSVGRAGEVRVGLGDERRDALDERRPGVAEALAGLGTAWRPTRRASPRSTRRGGRRPGAAACCAGGRCGRARGAAASYFTASATSVSSRKRRRSAGPPLTSVRSSGENTVTRTTPSRSRARAEALAVDLHPVASGRHELGLDQRRPPVVVADLGAHDGRRGADPHQRVRRRAAEAGQRRQVGQRLGEVRLALAVVADDDRRAGRQPERRRRVVAEVDQLEALDDHGRPPGPWLRAPAPASAGTGSRRGRRRG